MVKAAYGSGTPAIGVGPGNVPVYIEKSADINAAVNNILLSKTFDNGMVCASEQAVVVDREIRDTVMAGSDRRGLFPERGRDGQGGGRRDRRGEKEHVAEGRGAECPAHRGACRDYRSAKFARPDCAPQGCGEAYPLSREKLCPILGFYTVRNLKEGVNVCQDILYFGGLGHTASIASQDPRVIREFSETLNAGRIIVNAPSSQGAIGDIYTRIHPSLTLGCGAGGQNITTDNVSVSNLINIKRVTRRMIDMKWFRIPPQIYFEAGAFDTFFTKEIKELGVHRAFIVCTGSAIRQGATSKLENYLRQAGAVTSVYSDITPDPTVETVVSGAEAMKKFEPDLIIAWVGGLPSMRQSHVALLRESGNQFRGSPAAFHGHSQAHRPFPGTGTEGEADCRSYHERHRIGGHRLLRGDGRQNRHEVPPRDYAMTPHIAIVDPNLTLSVPPSVTADTGLDVLAHAIESYVSVLASDYTDPLALRAIQIVFEYLPLAFRNGGNLLAREKMHNASTIAGMAFTNAFLGSITVWPTSWGRHSISPRSGECLGDDPSHPLQRVAAEKIRDLPQVPLP